MQSWTRRAVRRLLMTGFVAGAVWTAQAAVEATSELRVGTAGHAFDHLGSIGDQADAAAESGATIIYVSGLGGLGYLGLPDEAELARQRTATVQYVQHARKQGIRLALGYVCSTSIVDLEHFGQHWTAAFRARFRTPAVAWRQQDRQGNPLPSWYGGQYQPACMNHPDWRAYEHFIVRQQLEAGCDGIFFDNPTVHPQGCYCRYCMERFADFLKQEGVKPTAEQSLAGLRELAATHPQEFLRFRCTIARDFLADMRRYARTVRPGALVTANNSLNSADVLYAQCRNYAYNIYELSKAEDFVVVEDMSTQPRVTAEGRVIEYGSTYRQLRAISHGKPIVAVCLAEADYHTPPQLVRLAMAEAAANGASHLWWPTWPEPQRARLIAGVKPQAEFLRQQAELLNDTASRRDVVLFLPFRNWLKTTECKASSLAAALARENIQFEVLCEDDFRKQALQGAQVLLTGSVSDFTPAESKVVGKFRSAGRTVVTAAAPHWMDDLKQALARPALTIQGPPTLRAVVRDQAKRTLVHLLNLNVARLSSFEDRVTPAREVHLVVRVPFREVRSVRALTADGDGTSGPLRFAVTSAGKASLVETWVPCVQLGTILVLE
jgi:hypothetical protein